MGALDRMRAWQDKQRLAGEARMERLKAKSADAQAGLAAVQQVKVFDSSFGDVTLSAGEISFPGESGRDRCWVAGATAEFELGAQTKKVAVGRVATGAILFGPAGAIVGGVLRKDKTRVYVTVTTAQGDVVIADQPASRAAEAREFAAKVNAAGKHFT